MVRILHAADFHLDSAYGALGEEQARQRRQESRELVRQTVDYANEQGVQVMLLAGDLFDSDEFFSQTGEDLALALSRFEGRAFIAPGNHDFCASGSAYDRILWPDNVHVFREDKLERVDLPELQCSVWGAGFTAHAVDSGAVLDGFAAPNDGWTHLLVLHGDLGVKGSRYRPLTAEQLAAAGVDYAALGHQHAFSGVHTAGKTAWAYSGCIEGRGFDELGEKGVLCGTVAPGRTDLRFVPMGKRRYEILSVDVTDSQPLSAVSGALPRDTEQDIYRIILTGETESPVRLEWLQQELGSRFYALELRDQTRMKQDLWAKCGEDSLRGLFLQELRKKYDAADDEAERKKIERAVRFGLAAMDNREM
ncbi:MAG: DNA repair exonuclease [Oscillospiraceae bacterium]|nr:DNA repair exonuclease [Oscillospiraceae bacterium]